MFSLAGKTAFITGSGRGIGYAIADALAQQGASIFLSDINSELLKKAQEDLKSRHPETDVRGILMDVTNKEQIERGMEIIKEAGNGLQILVNNAGINLRKPVVDLDDAT